MILYHVTPLSTHRSIAKTGIDPVFARGKQQLSWLVSKEKLAWAIAHTSYRHKVSIENIEVWSIDGHTIRRLRNTAWKGVYCTPCNVKNPKFSGDAIYILNLIGEDRL